MSTDTGVRIDAHHHLWDLTVRDQPWTEALPVLRRSFSMDDLVPELDAHDIDGTILVQTVTVAEETPELLALAAGNPRIFGVVGWVDLTAPDVAARIRELRALPGGDRLVGIRHQVQLEPDPAWLLRDDVRGGLEEVGAAGLVYELVVTHDQLPAAASVVERISDVRWVLDHAGKPPIATGSADSWRDHISALAAHPNVACKLSGLVTEAADDWTLEELRPYASHVLASFGADRVMVGSDWPVCLLRTTYYEVIALTELLVATLSPAEQLEVWGETASRWYDLHP